MGLRDLCQIHDAAQIFARFRNAHGHQLVTRFGGGDEMADRANAKCAPSMTAFRETSCLHKFLKAAKLGDVKPAHRRRDRYRRV